SCTVIARCAVSATVPLLRASLPCPPPPWHVIADGLPKYDGAPPDWPLAQVERQVNTPQQENTFERTFPAARGEASPRVLGHAASHGRTPARGPRLARFARAARRSGEVLRSGRG